MIILGIHDGHNAAACLLKDGEIHGLLQEERLLGKKNYPGFPKNAIKKLLIMNGLEVQDVDYFAFAGNHIPYPNYDKNTAGEYKSSYSLSSIVTESVLFNTFLYKIFKAKRRKNRIQELLKWGIGKEKIKFVEHHLTHAATAYYGCPWVEKDEKVLILTQDGSGDGLSATVNIGYNGNIERIAAIDKKDSLGRIYATTTFMMGMLPLEHEYKLMGLAPYAPEYGRERSYQVFKKLLTFPTKDAIVWKRQSGIPPMQRIYPYLRKHTELHRFDWIAAGLQKYTEEMLVAWVKNCIQKTGIRKLVMAGGTFMNVKANQKILELPEVEKLFVAPSCGDETNSIGATYHIFHQLKPDAKIEPIYHFYHGPDETDQENCLLALKELQDKNTVKVTYEYIENIEAKVAELLASGKVVARCKGPMEFGARALGNRSILCDASSLEKIVIINNMIKKRDFWMPFAPVVLKERANEYIQNPKQIEAPFMIITFNTTEKHPEIIGGIQQIDHTARPQMIDAKHNKPYYQILKEYEKLTGKGVLLNTSFNLHGLPIVFGPQEALYVLENSGLEFLALGNFLVKKS